MLSAGIGDLVPVSTRGQAQVEQKVGGVKVLGGVRSVRPAKKILTSVDFVEEGVGYFVLARKGRAESKSLAMKGCGTKKKGNPCGKWKRPRRARVIRKGQLWEQRKGERSFGFHPVERAMSAL